MSDLLGILLQPCDLSSSQTTILHVTTPPLFFYITLIRFFANAPEAYGPHIPLKPSALNS